MQLDPPQEEELQTLQIPQIELRDLLARCRLAIWVVLGPVAVGFIMLLSGNNILMPFVFLSLLGLLIGFFNFKLLKDDSLFQNQEDNERLKFSDKRVFLL